MIGRPDSFLRRSATAATAIAAFAGVAYLVLQLAISAGEGAEPRFEVGVSIVIIAGLLGFVVDRLRVLRARDRARADREDLLKDLLRYWPPRQAKDADPFELGVFPPDVELTGGKTDYVERDIDQTLARALRDETFVLVLGPAHAGKTRTTFEVARGVHPDVEVLAPVSGEALQRLTSLVPRPELGTEKALLWLDGLDRFLEVLGGDTLDWIRESEKPLIVVATIRDDDLRELLTKSGQLGPAAKRVLAASRGLELESRLSAAETARAQKTYPGLLLDEGLGRALASGWDDGYRPTRRELPKDGRAGRAWWPSSVVRRDKLLWGLAVLTLGGAITMAALIHYGGYSTPSIADQLQDIRAAAVKGRQTAVNRKLDLRGTGEDSYLLVFREKDLASRLASGELGGRPPASDEVRIYDIEGDELDAELEFQPRDPDLTFKLLFAGDLDGNGSSEIIASFARVSNPRPIPLAIYRDEEADKYRVKPLLDTAPQPALVERAGRGGVELRALYAERVELQPRKGQERSGYRVEDFTIFSPKESPRLLTAFAVRGASISRPEKFELQLFGLNFSRGSPELTPRCNLLGQLADRPVFIEPNEGLLTREAMTERWKKFNDRVLC